MRNVFVSASLLMAMALSAFGQAEIVKQKAKQQQTLNNQRQGVATPAPAPAATSARPTTAQPSTQPGIDPAQQALIDRVETDLKAIKAGTPSTPEQKQGLENDMTALIKGGYKPSKESLVKLSADLSAALAEKTVSPKDLGQVAKSLNIVLNSAFMVMTRTQVYATTTENLLKACGVSEQGVDTVGTDLKAIIVEIQRAKPKLYQ